MHNIQLQNALSLLVSDKDLLSFRLKYEGSLYHNKGKMSIKDFLTHLPVQFSLGMSSLLRDQSLSGVDWGERNSIITYITTNKTQPINLFSNLSYHQYDQLEADLKRINPDYKFARKSKYNLDGYIHYFVDAIKDMDVSSILEIITCTNKPISLDEFYQNFVCIDPKLSYYILPFKNVHQLSLIKETFGSEINPTPSYVLSYDNKKAILSFIEEMFYLVYLKEEKMEFKTYTPAQIKELADEIDLFFTSEEEKAGVPKGSINVKTFEHEHRSVELITCAEQVTPPLSYYEDFQEERRFFKEKYGVSGRSKQIVREKGLEEMKKQAFSLPKPYLLAMSSQTRNISNMLAKEPFEQLNASDKNEAKDFLLRLKLLASSEVIEDTNELMPIEHINNYGQTLFEIPDLGEMAKRSPSFEEIIKK